MRVVYLTNKGANKYHVNLIKKQWKDLSWLPLQPYEPNPPCMTDTWSTFPYPKYPSLTLRIFEYTYDKVLSIKIQLITSRHFPDEQKLELLEVEDISLEFLSSLAFVISSQLIVTISMLFLKHNSYQKLLFTRIQIFQQK